MLDAKYRTWARRNLAAGAARAADVLRREPWLTDDHLRSLAPTATPDDLMRAREVVAAEFCDEARARVAAAAGAGCDSHVGQRRVELRLLVESIAMLLTGRPPEQVDESLVTYALGEEFARYVRQAE